MAILPKTATLAVNSSPVGRSSRIGQQRNVDTDRTDNVGGTALFARRRRVARVAHTTSKPLVSRIPRSLPSCMIMHLCFRLLTSLIVFPPPIPPSPLDHGTSPSAAARLPASLIDTGPQDNRPIIPCTHSSSDAAFSHRVQARNNKCQDRPSRIRSLLILKDPRHHTWRQVKETT